MWDSVRWLGHSRGIMQGCQDVVLRNTRVEHEPSRARTEAMATPGGGRVLGSPAPSLLIFSR